MQSVRTKKPLSLYAAATPLACLVFGTGIGFGIFGMPTETVILFSACVAGLIAYFHGWTWSEILNSIIERICSAVPTLLTLLAIGALVGAWMAGGTIPLMAYAIVSFISPEYFYLSLFLLTGILSCFIGIPLLVIGLCGSVFVTMAAAGDMSIGITAGAIISGAYLGDRISPLSQSANIAAVVTGTGIYTHLKHMIWTSAPAIAVSLVVFALCGSAETVTAAAFNAYTASMAQALEPYVGNAVALSVPVIILVAGTILRMPTLPVIMLSIGFGIINASIFQGVAFNDACTAVIAGFDLTMLPGYPNEALLLSLFKTGGMASMLGIMLIICCAFTFAGTMMVSGAPMVIFKQIFKKVKNVRQLLMSMLGIIIALCGITANGRLAVILPGIMLKKVCMGKQLASQNLSRLVTEGGTMTAPLLPWTQVALAISGLLGVSTFVYLPWAFLNWVGVVACFFLAYKGISIVKMPAPAGAAPAAAAPATPCCDKKAEPAKEESKAAAAEKPACHCADKATKAEENTTSAEKKDAIEAPTADAPQVIEEKKDK